MKNSLGSDVRPLTREQLVAMVDPELRERVHAIAEPEHVSGIVVYEVLQMDSSQFGRRQFMIYGPGCTYKTLEDAAAGRLGDVPSRFAYPVAYWSKS